MFSVTLVLHLLVLLPSASAWHSSRYYRYYGSSLTFTPKGQTNGIYKVEFRNQQAHYYCNQAGFTCSSGNCGLVTQSSSARIPSNSYGINSCQQEILVKRKLYSNRPFEIRYPNYRNYNYGYGYWVSNFRSSTARWNTIGHVDLGTRSDTGESNKSPIFTMPPIIRITRNCPRSFNMSLFDPDGDHVRCRVPTRRHTNECGLCGLTNGLSFDQNSCSLMYTNTGRTGFHPVELVVEDFPKRDITLSYSDGYYTSKHPLSPRARKRRQAPWYTTAAPSTTTTTTRPSRYATNAPWYTTQPSRYATNAWWYTTRPSRYATNAWWYNTRPSRYATNAWWYTTRPSRYATNAPWYTTRPSRYATNAWWYNTRPSRYATNAWWYTTRPSRYATNAPWYTTRPSRYATNAWWYNTRPSRYATNAPWYTTRPSRYATNAWWYNTRPSRYATNAWWYTTRPSRYATNAPWYTTRPSRYATNAPWYTTRPSRYATNAWWYNTRPSRYATNAWWYTTRPSRYATNAPWYTTRPSRYATNAWWYNTRPSRYATNAWWYTTRPSRYATNAPWYTTRPSRYATNAPWYTTRPPRYATNAPWYTTRPSRYATNAWWYTTRPPRYATNAPWYTTRPSRYATNAWWYTTRPSRYATNAPWYTARPSRYATNAPWYTTRPPRYATNAPWYTTRPSRYATNAWWYTTRPSRYATNAWWYTTRPSRYATNAWWYTTRPSRYATNAPWYITEAPTYTPSTTTTTTSATTPPPTTTTTTTRSLYLSSIPPLSKLPLQFSIYVDSHYASSCVQGDYFPIFLAPTPRNGVNLPAWVNQTLEIKVISTARFTTIYNLIVTGPEGISRVKTATDEYSIKWTPTDDEVDDHFPICFISEARDQYYRMYQSEPRCVTVDVGHQEATVTCNATSMMVEVVKSYLIRRNEDNIHLNEYTGPSCNLSTLSNSTHVVAVMSLNSCGTKVEEDEDNIIYKNDITSADPNEIISRKHDVDIAIYCAYPKRTNLTLGFRHKNPYAFSEKGFGAFTFQFEFFETQRFRTQVNVSSYPVEVYLKQMIFMQIEATTSIPNTELFVESCRATPNDNPNSRIKYTIIENGCVKDKTVEIYPSSRTQFRFGMESFEFIGAHDEVYITCSVLLCETGVPGTRCSRGCIQSGNQRSRRAAASESSHHSISQGPLHLIKTTDNKVNGLNFNVILNVVFIVGCLVAVSVVVYRSKRSRAKYQRLPTSDVE